jgi:hypothetical protein
MRRKYSIAEIDRMRNAVRLTIPDRGDSGVQIIEIEERLRTYMSNGTEPEELEIATEAERIVERLRLSGLAHGLISEDD